MAPLIVLDHINYQIGDKVVLHDVNFTLHNREIVTVVGPNGAGKTTLLSIVLRLIKPTAGRVEHYPINGEKLRIGYVPQLINRDKTMPVSVLEFIRLSKTRHAKNVLIQLLNDLNIGHLAYRFLSDLSGGEMRRVLFARALLNQPHLLVLDEPTAGVDINGQELFYHQLNELRQRYHFAILMVSHDLHLVMSATDRVICLNQHICCQGKPAHVLNHPHYQSLFANENSIGDENLAELAFYEHHHAHRHDDTL
ncbi:MAG: zinc ABC transporter ATP-binding protein ZnuC [Gammaproteobacteria bacterium]|nr:MAG: zinc ABC transporter ATP-binding protein ZnuC [Gammaproteobacteria bacterium]